jgi:hypothetical protein
MSPKVKIGTEDVEGEALEFEIQKDPWQEIRLPDGAVLKIKLVVTDVYKTSKTDAVGAPVYVVRSVPVLASKSTKGEGGGS